MKNSVLIIDDEESICESLRFALQTDYEVRYCTGPEDGLDKLRGGNFDIVLLDLRLGAYDGLDILRSIREVGLRIAVIVMTAYGSEKVSVEAMKLGAYSYLTKPLDIEELRLVIEKALEYTRMTDDVSFLSEQLRDRNAYNRIIGQSPKMARIFALVEKLKDVDSSVLITGESGTGKELVARTIHYSGRRKDARFVVINCAAIPDSLLETEFFGYKKGAFTGAVSDQKGKFLMADKGTIFLDEIGDMPLSLQAKILRVLQEKEIVPVGGYRPQKVDVRVIAATNRDLQQMIRDGLFREDLFYRLNIMGIRMPALRERKEDILPLCEHFIARFNREQKKNIKSFSDGAKKQILAYDYPGNVRQLANIIEHAAILTTGDTISALALPEELDPGLRSAGKDKDEVLIDLMTGKSLREVEKLAIVSALRQTEGKKPEAARLLGISERGLWYKLKEYQIGGAANLAE